VENAGGYLGNYREYLVTGWQTGAQIIDRVAIENSINPRLLLAILEYKSHWVYGTPDSLAKIDYPMGYVDFNKKGLYQQLSWAVSQLSVGYYDWRGGFLNQVMLQNGEQVRISPELNAGTVALQYLFSRINDDRGRWVESLYGDKSLPELYKRMFGDPWARAQTVEPLYPPNLVQPPLELPFLPGRTWSFTGGPHSAWGPDGARAALDFAPPASISGCAISEDWVTASAPGQVVRSEGGQVVVDMDGDGREQTGWDMLYLHISTRDRIPLGSFVNTGDRLGHPSCEGGVVTGTHVHIARKYNGEWILADGPLPFNLSNWIAHAGSKIYEGTLTHADLVAVARPNGSHDSLIHHDEETP
jgi:LasA protease